MGKSLNAEKRAFRYVVNLILSHKLRPGDKIYEPDMVEELQMSRTPIRHALAKLVSEGMLGKKDRERGYVVPLLTPEDMEQVFTARETLEGKSAYLAAKYGNKESIEELKILNAREKELYRTDDKGEYAGINESIHLLIAQMSRNPYIERYVTQTYWRSQLYTFYLGEFYAQNGDAGESNKYISHQEHTNLINAIERGNTEEAREVMIEHIRSTHQRRFK